MRIYLVLLGPPGAGKGTQAAVIAEKTALTHISSGAIFREHLHNQTELGKKAAHFLELGELVPDDLTIAMIRERLERSDCASGALLDGFPRTRTQAEALDVMLSELRGAVKLVPYIFVPEQVLIERLSGRWTCRAQGHVFHETYNPPRQAGICDEDGSELYQREDDKADTIARRLRVYNEQTQPLIQYYQERGLLVQVDGTQSIDQVSVSLLKLIGERKINL